MKVPEFKRSRIRIIAELRQIPNGFPNKGGTSSFLSLFFLQVFPPSVQTQTALTLCNESFYECEVCRACSPDPLDFLQLHVTLYRYSLVYHSHTLQYSLDKVLQIIAFPSPPHIAEPSFGVAVLISCAYLFTVIKE